MRDPLAPRSPPVPLLKQPLHLAEPGVPEVAEPLEQHHLRGDDLRAVLPGPVDRERLVDRVARADASATTTTRLPATEQAEHGLQHADVRLAPRHHDLGRPDRQQRGENRVVKQPRRRLREHRLPVGRQQGPPSGRDRPGTARSRAPARRASAPPAPAEPPLAPRHRRHGSAASAVPLQVNQEHHGTFGGQRHAQTVPATTAGPTGRSPVGPLRGLLAVIRRSRLLPATMRRMRSTIWLASSSVIS